MRKEHLKLTRLYKASIYTGEVLPTITPVDCTKVDETYVHHYGNNGVIVKHLRETSMHKYCEGTKEGHEFIRQAIRKRIEELESRIASMEWYEQRWLESL